jgi:hypothetical protein
LLAASRSPEARSPVGRVRGAVGGVCFPGCRVLEAGVAGLHGVLCPGRHRGWLLAAGVGAPSWWGWAGWAVVLGGDRHGGAAA